MSDEDDFNDTGVIVEKCEFCGQIDCECDMDSMYDALGDDHFFMED
jgi:hypothetical protein